jgi:hypothetical protein
LIYQRPTGRSISDQHRSINDPTSVHQRPNCRSISDQPFGLSATRWSKFGLFFRILRALPTGLTHARDLNRDLTILTSIQTHRLKRGLRPLGALYGPNRKRNTTPPLRGLRPLPAQTQPTRHTPTRKALRASSNHQDYRAAALGGGKMDRVTIPVAALYPTLKEQST